jgi:hypothetical protein
LSLLSPVQYILSLLTDECQRGWTYTIACFCGLSMLHLRRSWGNEVSWAFSFTPLERGW